jgi:SOS response regulatory protein OraA/RecX
MASITNEEIKNNLDTLNTESTVICNVSPIQMSNELIDAEDTNGPADQEQYDEWVTQQITVADVTQEGLDALGTSTEEGKHVNHNKEKHSTKEVVEKVIRMLYDRNLLDDIEVAKKIGDKIVNTYDFEHSREVELSKLNVRELRSILRGKGLKISGRKEHLIQRIIAGPSAESGRKSCEAPFSELLLARAICNPNAHSYTDDNEFPECIITDALKEQYKKDMKTKTKEVLDKYFEDCKQIAHKLRDKLNITATDMIEVFVEGKCMTNPIILELTQSIKERTQKKADLYLRVNDTRWIGISVKTTPGDTKSNWSIERLIGEQDPDLKQEIKGIREAINKQHGIDRDWRDNKEKNRKIYNESMYGNNAYKAQINKWMIKPENKTYLQNIIAKAAGSSNHFEMYECNGRENRDLRGIYHEIQNTVEFNIVPDLPETSKYVEETLNQKSHYSVSAAKMWYYVTLNNTAKYRIEIRWKGEPYASPQLLLFDL